MKMNVIWWLVRPHPMHPRNVPYLHAILEFRDDRALRNERKELAAPGERQRDDQGEKDEHLRHQKEEHLEATKVSMRPHGDLIGQSVRGTRARHVELPLRTCAILTAR